MIESGLLTCRRTSTKPTEIAECVEPGAVYSDPSRISYQRVLARHTEHILHLLQLMDDRGLLYNPARDAIREGCNRLTKALYPR